MNKKGKFTIFLTLAALLLAGALYAGSLNQANPPTDAGTAMYTLEDIYNRLLNGTTATKRAGAFTEPGAAPASTGHTLDDIYSLIGTRAFVPKTGQTTSYVAGDDGDLEKGADTSPNPRFADNGDGTVTDNLTGLMWIQNPDATTRDWSTAITYCSTLTTATYTDWRLPNRFEMESLLDLSKVSPALPAGHPFGAGLQNDWYWTSTTCAGASSGAWGVGLVFGGVGNVVKSVAYYVLPVRGGQ